MTPESAPATEHLAILAQVAKRRARAQARAEEAERAWRESIRAAVSAGVRVTDIAKAAGISRERVYQIRDERR